jgi:hypothetical protein
VVVVPVPGFVVVVVVVPVPGEVVLDVLVVEFEPDPEPEFEAVCWSVQAASASSDTAHIMRASMGKPSLFVGRCLVNARRAWRFRAGRARPSVGLPLGTKSARIRLPACPRTLETRQC